MPAAIPLITAGVGAIGGALQRRSANKALEKSKQLSPEGQAAQRAMTGQAGQLNTMGGGLFRQGQQQLSQVGSYWSPLLSGSRGAIGQALAPEMAGISDVYRGAARNLDRSGIQGAQRTQASAELNRQRAGQLALLPAQMRQQAAGAMGNLGGLNLQQGLGTIGQAGGLYSQIYGGEGGLRSQVYNAQAQRAAAGEEAFGKGMGGLLFSILGQYGQGKAPLPGTTNPAHTPPYVPYPTSPGMNRPF